MTWKEEMLKLAQNCFTPDWDDNPVGQAEFFERMEKGKAKFVQEAYDKGYEEGLGVCGLSNKEQ